MNRRQFLKIIALGIGGFYFFKKSQQIKYKGKLLGSSAFLGHKLRDNYNFGNINICENPHKIIIIGAGIAGLSAGWWLQKQGFTDFLILELEDKVGGNSKSDKNKISAYPLGAHYIPLANDNSKYQKLLFEEMGIIQGYDLKTKLPIYNDLFLVHDQEERLFINGRWQDGLIPDYGLNQEDKIQINKFLALMEKYKILKGLDQKFAFNIPLNLSSQDPEFLKLDKISMKTWLKQNNFKSVYLYWYINYCCKDDYGAGIEEISAWAGIHYFASRKGKAFNAESNAVLTWPEGNGFIVNYLKNKLKPFLRTNNLVYKILENSQNSKKPLSVNIYNPKTNTNSQIQSEYIIFSAPRFLAKYIINKFPENNYLKKLKYIPWLVANISLNLNDNLSFMAWDNVNYYEKSLGYINAKHQNLTINQTNQTVITYYKTLKQNLRHLYFIKSHQDWCKEIILDLEKIHENISAQIENIDIYFWGHGMISPSIDFLWSSERKQMQNNYNNIYFAHSDMSGISIFEEAQYQGINSAENILNLIKSL